MNKYKIVLFNLALVIIGCKSEIQQNGDNSSKNNSEIISDDAIQKFTLNSVENQVINGKQGTIIKFKANSFVYDDNSLVKEEVSIELIECYELSDIIFNDLSSETTTGKLLVTNGMIELKATVNGKEVKLNKENSCEVGFPTELKEEEVYLFSGEKNVNSQCISWVEESKEKYENIELINDSFVIGDSIVPDLLIEDYKNSLDYYLFDSYKLGWMNCDKYSPFIKSKNKLEVKLGKKNAKVRMIFKNSKSIKPGVNTKNGKKSEFFALPDGEEVTLFGFLEKNGEYFLGMKDIALVNNMSTDLTFKKVTVDELKSVVANIMW